MRNQIRGLAHQDLGVKAHGNKHRAQRQVMRGQLAVRREDARRLAGPAHGGDAVEHGLDDLGVAGLAGVAHRRGQVGRADIHRVQPRRGADGVQIGQAFLGLDHGKHQDLGL